MDYVEKRMAQEAAKPPLSPEVQTIFSPINAILLSLLIYILYKQLKPVPPPVLPAPPTPTVFRTFIPATLLPYNGQNDMPVYLAVRGQVYDVSRGRNFYGPGGPYENFAGRDASRGLAKGSFDEEVLTKDLEGPLDKLEDLDEDELEALQGWEERFKEKYLVVGRLISVDKEKKNEEIKE
ncbi:BgTH12-03067 [Blumeria graminis f. sp. triticale]|nr:BgTH12-03067 [Blumeria graminis f. sp. triticale]